MFLPTIARVVFYLW